MGSGDLDLVSYILGGPRQDRPALISARGVRTSWAELDAAVELASATLRRALGATDHRAVAVCCDAADGFLVACLAVLRANAVLVPLNPKTPASARDAHLRAIDVAGTIVGATADGTLDVEPSEGGVRRFDPEVAVVLSTSGSSGMPKRVQLRTSGLVHNIDAILGYLPIVRWPCTGVVLPLSYSYGLIGQAFTALRAGGTVVMLAELGYPALQVEAMVALGVEGLSSVPVSLQQLARAVADREPAARPRLGYIASAGAPWSPAVCELVREAFPGARMFNQYGLTEASPRVTAISDEEEPFARGSVGRPIAGVSVCAMQGDKVCAPGEPGELVVRGPSVMLGFLDDADGTARVLRPEGLHSGDLGTVDAEGYVYVHGRNDDLVNVAGERISTHAIADTLRTLESVTDAFVVALPDAVLGYRLVAVVEAPEAALAQIRKAVRAELTPAQRPARVICVQHLPRSPNGKLDRARMRAWAEMGQADEGTAMCDRER